MISRYRSAACAEDRSTRTSTWDGRGARSGGSGGCIYRQKHGAICRRLNANESKDHTWFTKLSRQMAKFVYWRKMWDIFNDWVLAHCCLEAIEASPLIQSIQVNLHTASMHGASFSVMGNIFFCRSRNSAWQTLLQAGLFHWWQAWLKLFTRMNAL